MLSARKLGRDKSRISLAVGAIFLDRFSDTITRCCITRNDPRVGGLHWTMLPLFYLFYFFLFLSADCIRYRHTVIDGDDDR